MKTVYSKLAIRRWKKKGLIEEENGFMYRTIGEQRYEITKDGKKFTLIPVSSSQKKAPVKKAAPKSKAAPKAEAKPQEE